MKLILFLELVYFFESFFGGDNFVSSLADAFVSAVDRLRADGGGGGGAI